MMEASFAATVGVLMACGIYMLLRARTFAVIVGLTLVSYATSLFLLAMGRLTTGKPPVIGHGVQDGVPRLADFADPLPQALVLTAIVISFAMTALAVVLALRSLGLTGSDHVDGSEPTIRHRAGPPEPDAQAQSAEPAEERQAAEREVTGE